MLTKGIILGKEPNSNKYTIRLPLLESSASTDQFKIKATLCCDDGVLNPFNIGDVVFISFENSQYDKPVILGKLFKGGLLDSDKNTPSVSYRMENLEVLGTTQLSKDTKIGDISYADLFTLIQKVQNIEDKVDNMIPITWAALKALRDSSSLLPGRQYRITDYECTTTTFNTYSAGNQFDIVVSALDVNLLDDNASAIPHAGTTYFDGCKLGAWQLKYSLDNDTNRFAWADTANGKGVIYYMKDEWDNECSYDFKNIQFVDSIRYINVIDNGVVIKLNRFESGDIIESTSIIPSDLNYYCWQGSSMEHPDLLVLFTHRQIPSGTDVFYQKNDITGEMEQSSCTLDSIERAANWQLASYTFAANNIDASLQPNGTVSTKSCYNNVIKPFYKNNSGHMSLSLNFNVIRSANPAFQGYDNVFLEDCHHNFLGRSCNYNIFKQGCNYNYSSDNCTTNILGPYCNNIVLRNIKYSTFDYGCNNIIIGQLSSNLVFGKDCSNIYLPPASKYNTFGNGCHYINFSSPSASLSWSRFVYNIVEDGCSYINLVSSAAGSTYLQNVRICRGLSGSSSTNMITLTVERNLSYETTFKAAGSREVIVTV